MKKLNLGCGPLWKTQYPDYDGLDIHNYGQVYVEDILKYKFKDEKMSERGHFHIHKTYNQVMANHFLEHFDQDQLKRIFKMVYNILEPEGTFKFVVPHKDKESSWVLSHKTFWCEGTVKWLAREDTESVYGFGNWEIVDLVTNHRKDIHTILKKR